tara:strand:+ start:107 stop:307 length:201 start_codon:yes stop_codon:yes gene_type:complete
MKFVFTLDDGSPIGDAVEDTAVEDTKVEGISASSFTITPVQNYSIPKVVSKVDYSTNPPTRKEVEV